MIERERVDYLNALAEAQKEETLLNVVRLQHGDTPTFMGVSTIVASYRLSGNLGADAAVQNIRQTLGLSSGVTASNAPTVTYKPLSGGDFGAFLLQPIPPQDVFSMFMSGTLTKLALLLAVNSINDIENDLQPCVGAYEDAGSAYAELVRLLLALQDAGAIGIEGKSGGQGGIRLFFRPAPGRPEVGRLIVLAKRALNLPLEVDTFEIVYGRIPDQASEIAVLSRTVFQILTVAGAEQPVQGQEISVTPPLSCPGERPLIAIHSGSAPPLDPYVAVEYDGMWRWIAGDDEMSQYAFTLIQILVSLAHRTTDDGSLLVTVPAA